VEDFFENTQKLNIFEKIGLWWRHDGRYYHKYLKHGVKNLWYWFPIIWKDRNWDHHFIFKVLKHKLKAQANYIVKSNRHTRAQLDARNMTTCINLINKLQDDFYEMEYMNYVKDKSWFIPSKEKPQYFTWENEIIYENLDQYFAKYPLIYARVMKGEGPFSWEGQKTQELKRRIAMNMGHLNQQRAHKLLFKILQTQIQGWWN